MRGDGLRLVALAPVLPPAGQLRLAALPHRLGAGAQVALASRGDLAPEPARALAEHPNLTVRRRALARTTDADLLAGVRSSSAGDMVAVAQNRHSGPERLAELTRHPNDEVALRALCNAATPEAARRDALQDTERAARMVMRCTSPVGAQVVRAGELTATNRWLLAQADTLSPALLRGLLTLPECGATLLELPGASRWSSAALHPARKGQDPSEMGLDALAAHPSGAAHLELLSRPDATADHAARILTGHILRSGRQVDPEPHVLARIVRRFGSLPFARAEAPARLAGTRISTAAWAEAQAGELLALFSSYGGGGNDGPRDLGAAQQAADILGDDSEAWDVFCHLAAGPLGGDRLVEVAEAAVSV